jgi:hypothetical protein
MMKHHFKWKAPIILLVVFLVLHFVLPEKINVNIPSAQAEMSSTTKPFFEQPAGMSTSTPPLPEIPAPVQKPKKVIVPTPQVSIDGQVTAPVTAYSEIDSCHYAGCPMASGVRAYVGAAACPSWYQLGTKIQILGEIYTCEDRTATRLDGRFDIFMGYGKASHQRALQFGIQKLQVLILE